jgi:hypothetical protein
MFKNTKRALSIFTLLIPIVLSSCGDVCYECTKPSSTRGFCGEYSEMRKAKKEHESLGYSCKKVNVR